MRSVPPSRALPQGAVEDLDAGALEPHETVPPGAPTRVRGPGALLVVAVVAALVAGGLVAHRARATAAEREARLALQAGLPVSTATQVGPADARGWSSFSVGVPLSNRGSRPVPVSVLGLSLPGQRTGAPPSPVTVPAGATTTVPLVLQVRCAQLPQVGDLRAGVATSVEVLVRLPSSDADGVVRLPVSVTDRGQSLPRRLAEACTPGPDLPVSDVVWTPQPDGTLRVDVDRRGPGGGEDTGQVLVVPQASDGLRVASTPSLPDTVPAGQLRTFVLRLDPDCAVVGDGTAARVVLATPGARGQPGPALDDPGDVAVAWVARQVALRCG